MNITLDIVRGEDEKEITVDVELDHHKATRGHRDSFGAAEEPDEAETFEIVVALDSETGEEIELTEREQEQAIERAMDSL